MYKIIGNSKIWFIVSILLAVFGAAAILIFGLRISIDYKGGTVMELQTNNPSRVSIINETLRDREITSFQVKESGTNEVIVRMPAITNEKHISTLSALKDKLGEATETKYDTVGPTVGRDLAKRSVIAVILASLAIIVYIAYAFRRLPRPLSPWIFGLSAVIALVHDLLITTGMVALLGNFYHWMEVDVLFITALLTIMGFSVHDTIVVYDRLRENFIRNPHKDIAVSTEESANQTLVRSINTSLTVLIVLVSLLLLGGESIRHFILTLIIGMFVGTYSSIFVASPLIVVWHQRRAKASPVRSRFATSAHRA
ncbi:MAG: protein translocase subunit SecF [Patescibacteria group bacterium]|jgi:preprotein translocase subunit SecF